MAKQRRSKRVGTHYSLIERLDGFLTELERWPEITKIHIGAIRTGSRVNRGAHRTPSEVRTHQRSAGLGGGFSFHVTRWNRLSNGTITGIKCSASYGRSHQEIVLVSDDYSALFKRLVAEGYLKE